MIKILPHLRVYKAKNKYLFKSEKMVFESMNKKDLIKDCREKERNLQKKDDEILELRQLKDVAFQKLLHLFPGEKI